MTQICASGSVIAIVCGEMNLHAIRFEIVLLHRLEWGSVGTSLLSTKFLLSPRDTVTAVLKQTQCFTFWEIWGETWQRENAQLVIHVLERTHARCDSETVAKRDSQCKTVINIFIFLFAYVKFSLISARQIAITRRTRTRANTQLAVLQRIKLVNHEPSSSQREEDGRRKN